MGDIKVYKNDPRELTLVGRNITYYMQRLGFDSRILHLNCVSSNH